MRFIEEIDSKSDDLPWVNEYLNTIGESGDICKVVNLRVTPKGILIIGELFKAFIFRGSQTYSFLLEAIPAWKLQGSLPFCLCIQADSSGKGRVAVDDKEECIAIVSDKSKVDFKFPKQDNGTTTKTSTNPFLVGSPVPTTKSKSRKATESSSEVETD
jgi:hypothetical protein